ncbi:MAG: FCD domain-containing protein [Halioglobus sp.]|nr:FCD domain-containing protein [Halioglobus sp.]
MHRIAGVARQSLRGHRNIALAIEAADADAAAEAMKVHLVKVRKAWHRGRDLQGDST